MPFDATPVVRSPLPDNIAGQSALLSVLISAPHRLDRRAAGCSRPFCQQLGHVGAGDGKKRAVIFVVVALAGIVLAVILTRSLG